MKLKVKKEYKQFSNPLRGEKSIEVSIIIKNLEQFNVKNVLIVDKIPLKYRIHDFNFSNLSEYNITAKIKQREILIEIPEIKKNEQLVINYYCIGTGDFKREKPYVLF